MSMSECSYCHGKKTLTYKGIIGWYLFSDRLFVFSFVTGLLMMILGKFGLFQEWWGWLLMLVAFLFPIGWGHFKIFLLPVMLLAHALAGVDITCRKCNPNSFFTQENKSND